MALLKARQILIAALLVIFVFLNMINRQQQTLLNECKSQTSMDASLQNGYHHDTFTNTSSLLDVPDIPDDDSIAVALQSKVRVLVWVCTTSENLNTRTAYIKQTWGTRADTIVYFSSETDTNFPTIKLDAPEGRANLHAKTMKAFQYIYEHHFHDADWFFKADDDTYVIMENLKHFLADKNSSDPVYYGRRLVNHVHNVEFSHGGAGYVLSKEALRRLATVGRNAKVCDQDGKNEDVKMGSCMTKLGVRAGKSDDALGRSRFHVYTPDHQINGDSRFKDGFRPWFINMDPSKGKKGRGSISNYPISFHYVTGESMVTFDYLIYDLKVFGSKYSKTVYMFKSLGY